MSEMTAIVLSKHALTVSWTLPLLSALPHLTQWIFTVTLQQKEKKGLLCGTPRSLTIATVENRILATGTLSACLQKKQTESTA